MAAVRICCVSDTHGDEGGLGDLPQADVLLHGGDFTLFGREKHVQQFDSWGAAQPQPRECKVLVLGNHENRFVQSGQLEELRAALPNWTLLVDEAHEACGLRFFGTRFFPDAESASQAVDLPAAGIDVLVTHNPPHGHCDSDGCGHIALGLAAEAAAPKLHVFGHIHGGYGSERVGWRAAGGTLLVNAANVEQRKVCRPPFVVDVQPGEAGVAVLVAAAAQGEGAAEPEPEPEPEPDPKVCSD